MPMKSHKSELKWNKKQHCLLQDCNECMKGKLSQNISMRRLNSDETISCELAGDYAFPNINIQIHLENIDTYSDIE